MVNVPVNHKCLVLFAQFICFFPEELGLRRFNIRYEVEVALEFDVEILVWHCHSLFRRLVALVPALHVAGLYFFVNLLLVVQREAHLVQR